jgi:outer membrane receptor protein involved in Fe transport
MAKRKGCHAHISLVFAFTAPAYGQAASPPAALAAEPEAPAEDIVVTARQRNESLLDVPVAVTAISAAQLNRNAALDLPRIAELSPGIVVSNYGGQGGGSIGIRGISSPANALGFEQAVSVSVDGVQTSIGFLSQLGIFDVAQVEILKGPQALLFGKNSSAGVISIKTALPTNSFQAGIKTSYEFVADEVLVDAFVSGPLTDTLGARLAVRGRSMKGWLYNDARPYADNPFIPGPDRGIPGTSERRVGDSEFAGRVTLQFDPTNDVSLILRATYNQISNQGNGRASQALSCPTGFPNIFGVNDIFGECRQDNHLSNADPSPDVVAGFPRTSSDGRSFGKVKYFTTVLTGNVDLGKVSLTSVTGYNDFSSNSFFSHDQTALAQVLIYEETEYRAFSQEIRALSDFDGPFNLMVGGYYQDQKTQLDSPVLLNNSFFNPANGQFLTFRGFGGIDGTTVSAFAQGILELDEFEIAGGVRWTRETKNYQSTNLDGFPVTAFPPGKSLSGRFRDDNFSPEVTVSWHPTARSTVYGAYRTGYKSGSFNLTNPIQATSTIAGFSFGPENSKGFELGARGEIFDGKVFVDFNLFRYTFSDLQVNAFNPALVAYTTTNVGSVRQRGLELQAKYSPTSDLQLRANVAYTRNRFRDFVGQCYSYSFPAGDTTSPAPAGCRFRSGTRILEQDFEGRAPARSPDWAGNAGATYATDIPALGRLTLSGDTFYSSAYFASETMAPATRQPAFWRFNAGVTLEDERAGWSIGLLGRNLTNKYFLLFAADATGGTSIPLAPGRQRAVVARGREVALQFGYRF